MLRKILVPAIVSLSLMGAAAAYADSALYVYLDKSGAKGIPAEAAKLPTSMSIINPVIDGQGSSDRFTSVSCNRTAHVCVFTFPKEIKNLVINTAGLFGDVNYQGAEYTYVNQAETINVNFDADHTASLHVVGKIDQDDATMKDYFLRQVK